MKETAPEKFRARFATSRGDFVIEVTRAWSPNGADRFYNLVKNGYYDDCRFFRVVKRFMVQFGINGDPGVNKVWNRATAKDDPVKQSNKKGYVTFAMSSAPNSRTTQIFINYADNSFLDGQGFAPFGKVVEGMDIVDAINGEYGEKPDQAQIQMMGNSYLQKEFPKLDFVKSATIVTQ
ncbi:MAG: peptidylprolyl isomerase [Acidobacteria bacterium]|nr:peptidylprolyl isomerase [Acidobacteriota bacterium]